jgi:hypothetical protein
MAGAASLNRDEVLTGMAYGCKKPMHIVPDKMKMLGKLDGSEDSSA